VPVLFHLAAAGLMPDRYGSSAHPAGAWPRTGSAPVRGRVSSSGSLGPGGC